LIVAVIVYFYTVVPIYEKSVLDEEIAKRTIELTQLNNRMDVMRAQLTTADMQLNETRKHLNDAEVRLGNAQRAAETARGEAALAKRELAASLAQVEEVRKQLRSADERAQRLYSDLRTFVSSRVAVDMSSACANPTSGLDLALKEDPSKPRMVKLTDNLAAMCVERQLKTDEIRRALGRLSEADRALLSHLMQQAAAAASPQVQSFLKSVHEAEQKRRAKTKLAPLPDDELPVVALLFGGSSSFLKAAGEVIQFAAEQRRQDSRYGEIVRTALFRALDEFLKANPVP
jgi:chromosome segregation ATPase